MLVVGTLTYVGLRFDPAPSPADPPFPPAQCLLIVPEPGPARPWEASLNVATYTSVNMRHGNAFTVVPIIGWSGRGPALVMNLYHSSAAVDSALDLTRGMGFDLGAGWSCSYSDQLIITGDPTPTEVRVIADNGAQEVYTWDTDHWEPPAGVYDVLAYDGGSDIWTLTHKDQSYHQFDNDGLLRKVVDAAGNELLIERDAENDNRIDYIADAAGRELEFQYDLQTGQLTAFYDPKEQSWEPSGGGLANRSWTLAYDNDDFLYTITDPCPTPNPYVVTFTYDEDDFIESIMDKDGNTFTYDYTDDRLTTVTDPTPQQPPAATQEMDFECVNSVAVATYTDRRGSDWVYRHNSELELLSVTDPLGHGPTFAYDDDHNVTTYEDALSNDWVATYDTRGNLLTLTDPLSHVQEWTYDSLNNLTSYTDALDHEWTFEYEMAGYPTLLTTVTEPADGQGNPAAETTLSYYDADDDAGEYPDGSWNGLLKEVLDAEEVTTQFEYDGWGQLAMMGEGVVESRGTEPVYRSEYDHDSAGRLVQTYGPGVGGDGVYGGMSYDLLNRPRRNYCPPLCFTGTPEDLEPPSWFPDLPANPVSPGPVRKMEIWHDIEYTPMGQVTSMRIEADHDYETGANVWEREHVATYDELGRMTSKTVTSDEYDPQHLDEIDRTFEYDPDWVTGQYTRTGPDGVETFVQLDVANRVQSYRRGPANDPVLTATYTYYNDDRVHTVSFGNGAAIIYTYDAARRLTGIEHRNVLTTLVLGMSYDYYDNDLPKWREESDNAGEIATVYFTYDHRGRLIEEKRELPDETPVYYFSYEYDQVGNRKTKTDELNQIEVEYYYDIDHPSQYGSNNNRLQLSSTVDVSGTPTLLSETYYYYNPSGNVTRVVTNNVETDEYSATRFVYALNGQAVWYVMGETWEVVDDEIVNYDVTYIREFRYDGARQRYLNRELAYQNEQVVEVESVWSDYDGDTIYGDFEAVEDQVQGWIAEELRSFEPGIGKVDPWSPNGGGGLGGIANSYYHGDMLGTTRLMTNGGGSAVNNVTYTAFGERIDGPNHRYGYAGAHGYQAHDDCPYLHVGWRYYDPSSGRFLQRDPIGIAGGLNVYAYVGNNPVRMVDPDGLDGRARWVQTPRGPRWFNGRHFARPPWYRALPYRGIARGTRLTPIGVCLGLAFDAAVDYIDRDTARRNRNIDQGIYDRPKPWKVWLWGTEDGNFFNRDLPWTRPSPNPPPRRDSSTWNWC